MARLVNLKFPITYEAFVDYQRDAYVCSRMEVEMLRVMVGGYKDMFVGEGFGSSEELLDLQIEAAKQVGMSEREIKEFREKFLDG